MAQSTACVVRVGALALLLVLFGTILAEAQVYVVEEADGRRRFTTQYEPGAVLFMATPNTKRPRPAPFAAAQFREEIESAALNAGLEPLLVEAVIATESGFDPRAVSIKGAQGLMQLMPATATRFDVSDVWDPAQNIRGGTAYLQELMQTFNGDLPHVLAAYNAGETAVLEHGGVPPYAETQNFIRRVLDYYRNRGGR